MFFDVITFNVNVDNDRDESMFVVCETSYFHLHILVDHSRLLSSNCFGCSYSDFINRYHAEFICFSGVGY